jgi:hypothetical protein
LEENLGAGLVLLDVTEKKRTEEALRNSQMLYWDMVGHSVTGCARWTSPEEPPP